MAPRKNRRASSSQEKISNKKLKSVETIENDPSLAQGTEKEERENNVKINCHGKYLITIETERILVTMNNNSHQHNDFPSFHKVPELQMIDEASKEKTSDSPTPTHSSINSTMSKDNTVATPEAVSECSSVNKTSFTMDTNSKGRKLSFQGTEASENPKLSTTGFTTAAALLKSSSYISPVEKNASASGIASISDTPLKKKSYTIKPSQRSFPGRRAFGKDIQLIVYPVQAVEKNFTYVWKLRLLNDKAVYKSTWTEKRFVDAVTDADTHQWASSLGFDSFTLPWYDNNQPVLNDKGYSVRLFIQRLEGEPFAKDALYKMAKDIASSINSMDSVKQKVSVSEEAFLASSTKKFVWQEIIGSTQAFAMMKEDIGHSTIVDSTYYLQNREVIHCYFRERTFTPELQKAVNAPTEQLHSSFLKSCSHISDGSSE